MTETAYVSELNAKRATRATTHGWKKGKENQAKTAEGKTTANDPKPSTNGTKNKLECRTNKSINIENRDAPANICGKCEGIYYDDVGKEKKTGSSV